MSTSFASGEQAKRMASTWAMLGGICWMLGLIFAILGIIAEAAETSIGLTPISWYLLAVALFAGSVAWYIGWAVGLLLKK